MSTEKIVANDPRNDYQKMSRREVWAALKSAKIEFPAGIDWENGVKLLQANAVDPRKAIEWEAIEVEDENKNVRIQYHPKRTEPTISEADIERREMEMARRLEEAAKKESESKDEITDLKKQLSQLAESNKQMAEILMKMRGDMQEEAAEKSEQGKLSDMTLEELRERAASLNIKVHHRAKESTIIKLIQEAGSGSDTTHGSE